MKQLFSFFLLSFLLSTSIYSNSIQGKVCLESDDYTISYDKEQTIYIYDASLNLLNQYTFEKSFPRFKNRMKFIGWSDPEDYFSMVPKNNFSHFYENETHLIFAFSVLIGKLETIDLLFFDKAQNSFEFVRSKFPLERLIHSNNFYINKDKLYLLQITASTILIEIRELYQPDELLHQMTYQKGEALHPTNTSVVLDYEAPILFGIMTTGGKTFDEKEEAKSMKKIMNKGSKWGCKIKAFPLNENTTEITLGTHYIMTSGPDVTMMATTEKLFYFKVVLDSKTYEHIDNQQLDQLGLQLSQEKLK